MNWINTAENLGITLISFIVGVLLGAFVTFQITQKVIDSNQKVLIEAINKESTAINNEYDIKNKKGTLEIIPTNDIESNESNIIIKDTIYHKKWYQLWKK